MQQTIETILSDLEYAGFDQNKIATAFIDKCKTSGLNPADVGLRLLAGYVQLGNGVGRAIQKGKISNPATAVALQSLISATGVTTSVSGSESVTLPRLAQCFPETVMQLRMRCQQMGLTLGSFADERDCELLWQDPCLGGLSRCPAGPYKAFLRGFQRAMFRSSTHKDKAAYLSANEEGKARMVEEEVMRWEQISLSKGRVQLYEYYGGSLDSDLSRIIRLEMALYIGPRFLGEGKTWVSRRSMEGPEQSANFQVALNFIDSGKSTLKETAKEFDSMFGSEPEPAPKAPEKSALKKTAATGDSASKKVSVDDSVTASSFGKP